MTLLKHRISAHLFQNFREFLVRNFDFDTANQAVPTYLLDQIEIAAADFADSEAIRLIDRESLLAIKNALEMSYTDGITAITEAYLQPDDSITGKFIDKVNSKITKRLEFKLTDEELSYTLVNDRELANFSEEDWLDFAAATKPKNCKKGIPCGGSCIAVGKQCKSSSPAQQTSNKKAVTTAKKATTGKKAAVPAAPAPPANPNVKINQAELDKSRADLIKRFGKKAVEDAEKNVHDILKSDDTQVYIRVGKTDTLEKILGDRFRTSAELNVTDHNIPHLQDDYQTARNRVEEKTLGYGKNTKPEDRPIYGYFGSKDPNQGASHHDVDDAYGSITVKLKPEVKDRSTFTGADSFKSGIGSDLNKDGTPPPPNAASLVATTRHGYDRDDLPSHYPSYFKDKSGDKSQLTAAAKAKNIDDLAQTGAPTGNRYVEAQIHGKITPKDIAEIHFNARKADDRPSAAVARFAKDNGVDLFVDGKKLSKKEIDAIIKPPKPKTPAKTPAPTPNSQQPSATVQKLADGLENKDYKAVVEAANEIHKKAQGVRPKAGEDRYLKQLYKERQYDAKPKVASADDVTQEWKKGGTLMVRGIGENHWSGKRTKFFDEFKHGAYYVGKGVYGNGTYTSSANGTKKKDAEDALNSIRKHLYSNQNGITMRMVLDKDAKVVSAAKLIQEKEEAKAGLKDWKRQEKLKILKQKDPAFNINAERAKIEKEYGISTPSTAWVGYATIKVGNKTISVASHSMGIHPTHHQYNSPDYKVRTRYYYDDKSQSFFVGDNKGGYHQVKTTDEVAKLAVKQESERILLQRMTGSSHKAGKELAKIDDQVKKTHEVLFKDDEEGTEEPHENTSGRFAVAKGYDAVRLEHSYEPDHFTNLLNRGKVTVQDTELNYNTAMNDVGG